MEAWSGFTFENLICGSNKCYVSSGIKKKQEKGEDMNGGKKQDEKTRWETACPNRDHRLEILESGAPWCPAKQQMFLWWLQNPSD